MCRFLRLSLVLLGIELLGACRAPAPKDTPRPSEQAAKPILLRAMQTQENGKARIHSLGEPVRSKQDFALAVDVAEPLHLYVVVEHGDGQRALLHPLPTQPAAITATGATRLPPVGDWFMLDKAEAGDRLCLLASKTLLSVSQLSCGEPQREPGREPDEPPPQPAAPPPQEPPRSPPPPDDDDGARGKRRWVIQIPLTADASRP